MQTTTFYAYKGGTGRTLTLANAAKYLSRLGQSVLAIDLDLEAPGLHHKLRLGGSPTQSAPGLGVVDYLSHFIDRNTFPDSLAAYVSEVPKEEDRDGSIRLMAAGNILDPQYWRRLARINWHNFLFGDDQQGLLFFLELKERIRAAFKPDFLLVDARTGITEVGGVATTLLPDQVVCFLLNNQENLEGMREVLRGIERASTDRPTPIRIVPVLSRLPRISRRGPGADGETRLVDNIRHYLCESTADYPKPLELPPLYVLHSEETLAYQESLRIGNTRSVGESPLLRDYLRLFSQIIPSDAVTPHLDRLVSGALTGLLERPDRAQSDLEALAEYCPHPTSYMALLKLYRLRNVTPKLILRTAVRCWEFSGDSDNPFLRQVAQESFQPDHLSTLEEIPLLPNFVESIWYASPDRESGFGLKVAGHLFKTGHTDRAVKIIHLILDNSTLDAAVITESIQLLIQGEQYDSALQIIELWAPKLADNPEFQAVWASAVVSKGNSGLSRGLFESKHFRPAIVMSKAPYTYIRLMMQTGKREEMEAALTRQLEQTLAKNDFDQIVRVARIYDELGRLTTFKEKVRDIAPRARAERVLSIVESRLLQRTLFSE